MNGKRRKKMTGKKVRAEVMDKSQENDGRKFGKKWWKVKD